MIGPGTRARGLLLLAPPSIRSQPRAQPLTCPPHHHHCAPPAAEVVQLLRQAGASVMLTVNVASAPALRALLPGDLRELVLDEGGRLRPPAGSG